LTTDSGEWAADFIGRSEHFDEDFAVVVEAINQRLPPGVEPLSVKARPESQNTNEVSCSDKVQPRRPKKAVQPGQDVSSGSSAGQEGASSANSAAATAAGQGEEGGAAEAAAAAGQGVATEQAVPAEGAAGEQHGDDGSTGGIAEQGQHPEAEGAAKSDAEKDPRAVAQTAQEQEEQGQQEGEPHEGQQSQLEAARRRLLYGKLPGFLFAEENYCDKRKFYTGRHEACFQQIARFYGNDVQRLGFTKLLRTEEGRDEEASALMRS
jgi:hypothetical protein